LKSKIIIVLLILFIAVFSYHPAKGEVRTRYFARLIEHTYDDQQFTIYRGNSVDYRSSIQIRFIDSLVTDRSRMKVEARVIRKNGEGFKIPLSGYPLSNDSETTAVPPSPDDSNRVEPLKGNYISLKRWAVEPGDKLHVLFYEDGSRSRLSERYVPVKKQGLQGDITFPILSVQRSGEHPGSLGAGLSYTGRYVHRDNRLLDKIGWGGNISFLDFESDQKIEIGLGFVLTFPDDIFQIGVGKNLTIDHDSGYYFLGINLWGVKEKLGW
jgi:hypothetical protein